MASCFVNHPFDFPGQLVGTFTLSGLVDKGFNFAEGISSPLKAETAGHISHIGQIIDSPSLSRPFKADLLPILYGLAHGAGWDPKYPSTRFLGWICTMQILHNLSQRQVWN